MPSLDPNGVKDEIFHWIDWLGQVMTEPIHRIIEHEQAHQINPVKGFILDTITLQTGHTDFDEAQLMFEWPMLHSFGSSHSFGCKCD